MKTNFCYDSLKLSGPWLCFESLDVRYQKNDVELCFIEKREKMQIKARS